MRLLRETADLILAPYEEALRTLEVTLAANRSAETGEPVTLSGNGPDGEDSCG
ncbi:hypothetical protein LJK87_05925 [Paenibacillus sp. P25]|nr:hypothetical protein LJK87_05925 [Paenibacillus sp. P25]